MSFTFINLDCIKIDNHLIDNVDLVYTDPPYSSVVEDQYYGVGNSFESYIRYMIDRIKVIKKVLNPDGSNTYCRIIFK